MKFSALLILLAVQPTWTTGSFAATLRAGAGTVNITPPLGIEIKCEHHP